MHPSKTVMSDCESSCRQQKKSKNNHLCEGCEGSQDGGMRLKRREKNRVAAQKSRKRQTQRADLLHEACELLEQRNTKLRREVDSLCEEQRLLTETLRTHEPFCEACLVQSNYHSTNNYKDQQHTNV